MIKVVFNKLEYSDGIRFCRGENEFSIKVSGHSGFDVKGKDIVCAAVSVLFHTLLVSISKIALVPQKITDSEGILLTEVVTENLDEQRLEKLSILINSFGIGIFEMIQEYPEYINAEFED